MLPDFPSLFIVLALANLTLATTTLHTARNLVPAKRALHLERRDAWRRDIVPSKHVKLNYGVSTFSEPSAHVSFTAHDGRPILLLEDVEDLFESILCTTSRDGSTMLLVFGDEDAYTEATQEWGRLSVFTIVTSHPTCNGHDERGAWVVRDVKGDDDSLTMELSVMAIGLDALGHSCNIRYEHTGAGVWQTEEQHQLQKRAASKSSHTAAAGISTPLPQHATVFPLKDGNVTMVSQSASEILDNTGFQLTCIDCGFKANFTLGIEIDANISTSDCASFSSDCATVSKANVNFTVVDLEQPVDLEVFLEQSFSHTLNFTILQIPLDGFVVANIIDIGPSVGVELGLGLGVSGALNFTFGATAQVPSGTFASFDLVDETGHWAPAFQTTGWDQAGVTVHPFRVNSGQFNVTADIYLAPFVEVGLELFNTGFATRLLQQIPKYSVDAALVTGVNRDCQPIGPNDFETFETAFVVGANLELATGVHFGFEGFLLPDALAELGFPVAYDASFFNKDFPLPPSNSSGAPKCIIISDDSPNNASPSSLSGAPGPTGTMVLAESAVPTWDFPKIESYSSANGHLPTNVNYDQMVRATVVPPELQKSIQAVATGGTTGVMGTLRLVTCVEVILAFMTSAVMFF